MHHFLTCSWRGECQFDQRPNNSSPAVAVQVCRGLFEIHRPLFSFLIATAIQRAAGTIPGESWSFLLQGTAGTGKCSCRNAYATIHMLEPDFLTSMATAFLNRRAIAVAHGMFAAKFMKSEHLVVDGISAPGMQVKRWSRGQILIQQ